MSPANRNLLLLVLNTTVWSLNALTYKGNIRLNARSGIPVTIDMEPARARLIVDGKMWEGIGINDGWVQSPAIIRLPAGQHKMLLTRPGYAPHSFKALVTEGDHLQLKMIMEALEGSNRVAEIIGEGPESETINASLDEGLEEGTLPIRADDLTAGHHTLTLKLGGLEGLRAKPYTCSFEIKQNDISLITKITVSKNGKKLKVTGCKRSKDVR